jgi:quercetin dioxygenase-like cupin family protein
MSDYFTSDHEEAHMGAEPGRFVRFHDEVNALEIVDGLRFWPVVGSNVMVCPVEFEPHTEAPTHAHPEEQVVYVLSGEVTYRVGNDERLLTAGDIVVIPPFTPHGAWTGASACTEVDIFSPPRQALIDLMDEADR